MKRDLKRIEVALHQLAQTNDRSDRAALSSGEKAHSPSFLMEVAPSSLVKKEAKMPNLPKLKPPSFSNHRNATNPALATNILKDIETIVGRWQQELQKISRQIQDLYLEGPIIDGWLESPYHQAEVKAQGENTSPQIICESPRAEYRLCGLNESGQLWSLDCPPDQVPSVSVAIARYQKLRQLLNRQQHLETRLNQLAETLVVLHGHLNED